MNQHTRLKRRMAKKWPKSRLRRIRILRTWSAEAGDEVWIRFSAEVARNNALANRFEARGEK